MFKNWFILIAIVLVAVGGYFLWQQVQRPPPKADQPRAEETQQQMQSELAGWKTYRNEEVGFEVKYPRVERFEIKKQGADIYLLKTGAQWPVNPASLQGVCKVSVFGFENKSRVSLDEWYKEIVRESGGSSDISQTKTSINNFETLLVKGGEITLVDSAYISKPDQSVVASLNMICGDDFRIEGEKVFNQILSTFKFIK